MARFIMPVEQLVNSDASGIASGWKLNFYVTGTTTRKDTFSDSALTTANANPVVADSAGRFGDIFLESGTYKVVLTDGDDTEIWTADPVDGAPGSSGAIASKTASYTVTISDATKTILVDATTGDLTITLLAAATAGDGFEVTIKKTDATVNNVTIDGNGSETIDGESTFVMTQQYQTAVLRTDGSNWYLRNSLPLFQADTDVASASALAVDIDGNFFDVTGTTTITSLNSKGLGTFIALQFDGVLTLTHHATNLILPSAANIATAAGDIAVFWEYGIGTWRCVSYQRADGASLLVASQSDMEAGTSVVATVTPGRQHYHQSAAKFWCVFDGTAAGPITPDAEYNVVDVTDNSTGNYTVNIDTDFSSADWSAFGAANREGVIINAKAAGTVTVIAVDGSGVAADASITCVCGFGDQ